MVKKLGFFLLVLNFAFLINMPVFGAELSSFSLCDTIYSKPEIVQYFFADNTDNLTAEALLEKEQLSIEKICSAKETGITTNYIYLVDESTSMSGAEMSAIKASLYNRIDELEANETMSLIAFGENIDIKTEHSSDKNELKGSVDTLINNKEGTVFFDAIKKASEICRVKTNERNIVIIISDGIDFNVGGYTYEEVEKYVRTSGLTLFAAAFGTMESEYIDKFGQLVRESSGLIEVCQSETADSALAKITQKTRAGYAIVMSSKNNLTPEDGEKLIINFSSDGKQLSLEKRLYSKGWVKDELAPQMVSLKLSSANSLSVTFSESVVGADNPANFKVTLNKIHELAPDGVAYNADTNTADLVFGSGIFTGEYSISCPNITDNSMEHNAVGGEISERFHGISYEAYMLREAVASYWLFIVLIMLAGAGIIAYIVINRRKGIVIHEKKMVFRDNMVDKERIITPEITNICLIVTNASGLNKRIEMKMHKSIIVGRSSVCDLSFDDPLLSRQHFAIEENDNVFTVMNLSSTNGTLLNGVKVTGKYRLREGDVIEAGNERFIFMNK